MPGIAIASRGPVRTVMLIGEVPWEEMTASFSTGLRARRSFWRSFFCKERGLAPTSSKCRTIMIANAASGTRGGLIIGDLGLPIDVRFPHVYDLGAEWTSRWDCLSSTPRGSAGRVCSAPKTSRFCKRVCRWAGQSGRNRTGRGPCTAATMLRWASDYLAENIRYASVPSELSGAAAFLDAHHAAGLLARSRHARTPLRRPGAAGAAVTQSPCEHSLDSLLSDAAAGARLPSTTDFACTNRRRTCSILGQAADASPAVACIRDGVVTYIIDRNVNYTNACTTACHSATFYRPPGDDRIYTLNRDELARQTAGDRRAGWHPGSAPGWRESGA